MGIRFLKIAAIYLVIGVSMGLAMGITQNFALHPVHAHINLLGWATMALAGLIYVQFPRAAQTRLAKIHFWLHNLALPVMMVGLAFLLSGHDELVVLVEAGSTTMVVALVCFVVNICMNVREGEERRSIEGGRSAQPLPAGAGTQ